MSIIYEIEPTTKFRKMPALRTGSHTQRVPAQHEQEWSCQRRTGHILTVHGDAIKCSECGAEWRDEGF